MTAPIAFDDATGQLNDSVTASAKSGTTGTFQEMRFIQDSDYEGGTFHSPVSGLTVVRLNWQFDWKANLSASYGGGYAPNTAASYSVSMSIWLNDLTTGAIWGQYGGTSPYSYQNQSGISGTGSLVVTENAKLSLPTVVPLTAGDAYSFEFALGVTVYASADGTGSNSAVAEFQFGTAIGPTLLSTVTVS